MGLCCCKVVDDEIIDDRTLQQDRSSRIIVKHEIQPPTEIPRSVPPESTTVDTLPNKTAEATSHVEAKLKVLDEKKPPDAKKIQLSRKELQQQILVARREKRRTQSRKKVESNEEMLVTLMQNLHIPHIPHVPAGKAYTLEPVYPDSNSHIFVMGHFSNKKFRYNYEITRINRVWNPYLFAQFVLKKNHSGNKFNERHLFHGTGHEGALGIVANNFDWRKVKNGRYGWGVSFANNPWYASHYGKNQQLGGSDYVMILAKVLIEDGEVCKGNTNTIVPLTGHTTANPNGEVLVKYDDGTFYPEFIVYFRPRRTRGFTHYY